MLIRVNLISPSGIREIYVALRRALSISRMDLLRAMVSKSRANKKLSYREFFVRRGTRRTMAGGDGFEPS